MEERLKIQRSQNQIEDFAEDSPWTTSEDAYGLFSIPEFEDVIHVNEIDDIQGGTKLEFSGGGFQDLHMRQLCEKTC